MEDGEEKKVSLHCFSADREFVEEIHFLFFCFLHPIYSTSKKILLVARHILTTGLKNAFKVDSRNPLSPPVIVKKVRTGSKSDQGT